MKLNRSECDLYYNSLMSVKQFVMSGRMRIMDTFIILFNDVIVISLKAYVTALKRLLVRSDDC